MGSASSRRSRRQQRHGQGSPTHGRQSDVNNMAGNTDVALSQSQHATSTLHPGHAGQASHLSGSGAGTGAVAPPATKQSNLHQTTTVRNLVNLKKSSLCLTPRKDDANVLDITFVVDAVQECNVSIFLLGKEDRKTGQITARQVICDNARCPVGMNVKFPFPDLTAEQFCIHTDSIPPEQLRSADVSTFQYPLFIRLETLADKAAATQHDLSERVAGAPLAPWIQCQTTCAVLGQLGEGEEESCKVVRQRIWVHELFYDLQEIYGITEANQAANGEGDFSADCVVCLTNRKNTTVLPCRHFCMCNECAKALLRRTRTCPMCRLPISSVLQIQIQQGS